LAVESKKPAHLINAESIGRFVGSEAGRETIRRELVECGQVKAGEQALILLDDQAPDGTEQVIEVIVGMLRQMGLGVTVMHTDALLPLAHGGMPGSFASVEKYRLPKAWFQAILAADVVFDYTASGRGAQKYNVDFYTLSSYYGKRIIGRRAVEAPEVMWSEDDPNRPNAEAMLFPGDLLRAIGDRINEKLFATAETQKEFRLTNPWGTDLRFTTLPGDICAPSAGIRRHPRSDQFYGDDSNRLYRGIAGVQVTQTCEGVWVTRFCSLLGGRLSEPITIRYKDGFIAGAEGGPDAKRLLDLIADEPAGVHAILMGINPKATPFRAGEYMLGNDGAGAGVAHIGMGGAGMFYRSGKLGGVGANHFQVGNLPKISWWAGDECICRDGVLLTLQDPAIREKARQYGNPDELLRQFSWPAEV